METTLQTRQYRENTSFGNRYNITDMRSVLRNNNLNPETRSPRTRTGLRQRLTVAGMAAILSLNACSPGPGYYTYRYDTPNNYPTTEGSFLTFVY